MKKIRSYLIVFVLFTITAIKPLLTYFNMENLYEKIILEEINFNNIEVSSNEDIKGLGIKERIKILSDAMNDSDVNLIGIEYDNIRENEKTSVKNKLMEQITVLKTLGILPNEKTINVDLENIVLEKMTYTSLEKSDKQVNVWEAIIDNSKYHISLIIDADYYVIYQFIYFEKDHKGNGYANNSIYNFFNYLGFSKENFVEKKTRNEYSLCFSNTDEENKFDYYYVNQLVKGSDKTTLDIEISLVRL